MKINHWPILLEKEPTGLKTKATRGIKLNAKDINIHI